MQVPSDSANLLQAEQAYPDIQEEDLVLLTDTYGSSEGMAHGACLQGLALFTWKGTQN